MNAQAEESGEKGEKNNTQKGVKYSIEYTEDNRPIAIIEDDILKGVPKSQWIKIVKNTITNKFLDDIPIKGRIVKVNRITKMEYTNSKYSKYLRDNNGFIYRDKFKSANNLDEIVLASTNYINEDLKHKRKDNFKEFARGDVLIRVGKNDYSAKVIIGFTSSNQMVLYDIIDFVPENFIIKKESTPNDQNNEVIRSGMLSNKTIPHNNSIVNNNYMKENQKNSKKAIDNNQSVDDTSDIRYAVDDEITAYSFRKALNKKEWVSFYASLEKSNQRNSFRIGNNGILIPDENNSSNYKLVCYEGDSQNPVITAVYKLENYDYNIHDGSLNIAQTIIDLWEAGLNEEYRKTILQNYTELSKTILKRYNSKSREFVKLTRASVSNRKNNRYESNRTGTSENAGQGISGEQSGEILITDNDTSDIRLAVDDTITDGYFADGDLFDDEGYIEPSIFEKAVKDNPDFALSAVYNRAAKTAETAIKKSKLVKLDDKAYIKIANKLMSDYGISEKLNNGFREEFAETVKRHTKKIENSADFAGELELIVEDCRNALLLPCFSEKRQELLQCILLCLNLIQSITGISTSLCFCSA